LANILDFVPEQERSPQENLAEFIRVCKEEVTVFGKNLNWQDNVWTSARLLFGNLEHTKRKLTPAITLAEPFLDFAKAYVRYGYMHNRVHPARKMQALKCLERALIDCNDFPDMQFLTFGVLDRAAVLARAHYGSACAYGIGRHLELLSTFVSAKKMVPLRLDWKNPIPRPNAAVRTGIEARKMREKKLPSNEVLNALADIFAKNPQVDRDIFTTSVFAMLLCTPSRISEVLALQEDCEIRETKRDGSTAYGWRFKPAKGGPPMIKWIPDSMASLAKEAVHRVRNLTAEARRNALWLERNPGLFYRHSACPDVPENQPLSVREAAISLGIPHDDVHYCSVQLRVNKLSGRNGVNSLATLNQWVHKRLPNDFPWFDKRRDLRFSEALFCLSKNQINRGRSTVPVLVWKPTPGVVSRDLCTYTINGITSPSIFERHNKQTLGEAPLKANTHQCRHLLNTMAQRGGLGQAEIARWSGRKDAKQNREYDHMSEFELTDLLRSHDSTLTLDRPLAEIAAQVSTLIPMTRQQFNTLSAPTAHVTEFGFCVHDYVMSPCQHYRDCINCTEQVCIKGDKRLDSMRIRYSQIKQLKQRAEEAIADGYAGADRWYEIQALTEKRLAALIAILEDPSIKEGAIVRLKNEHEFSPLRRALDAKASAKLQGQKQLPVSASLPIRKKRSNGKTS